MKNVIEQLMMRLGFEKIKIDDELLFKQGSTYYKITYIDAVKAYVIEYADTEEDMEKGLFWDGDMYPLSLGDKLLNVLEEDLKKYYID